LVLNCSLSKAGLIEGVRLNRLAVFGFVILVLAYKQVRKLKSDGTQLLYSDNIFPVYEYLLQPGLKNPLVPNNRLPLYIYTFLGAAFVWAVLAIYFVEDTAGGKLCVYSILIVTTLAPSTSV